jgi:uncharacterized protein YoxC
VTNVISFTLKDIGMFVLWGLLVVILWYLILVLKSLYLSVRDIRKIIKSNQENVDLILNEAPGISKNANNISKEVSDTLIKFRGSIDNVAESTENITETLKENDTINKKLASIFQTLNIFKTLYEKHFGKEEVKVKNEVKNHTTE